MGLYVFIECLMFRDLDQDYVFKKTLSSMGYNKPSQHGGNKKYHGLCVQYGYMQQDQDYICWTIFGGVFA